MSFWWYCLIVILVLYRQGSNSFETIKAVYKTLTERMLFYLSLSISINTTTLRLLDIMLKFSLFEISADLWRCVCNERRNWFNELQRTLTIRITLWGCTQSVFRLGRELPTIYTLINHSCIQKMYKLFQSNCQHLLQKLVLKQTLVKACVF